METWEIKIIGFLACIVGGFSSVLDMLQSDNVLWAIWLGICTVAFFYYAYKFCTVRISRRGILN